MPFLRFSRDKRGYEHTYLMHTVARRGKPARNRILYWYRTPPGVRVGRPPFDEEVRRTIEARNPGVVFDWEALASTPMPPPEPEHWREKRRAEKAARLARRAEEAEEAAAAAAVEGETLQTEAVGITEPAAGDASGVEEENGADVEPSADAAAEGESAPSQGRRRRRRGGRRRRGRPGETDASRPSEGGSDASAPAAGSASPTSDDSPSEIPE